jgi:hypothetical protein
MVQPYNYTIQAPSAFEQLASGLKLGASMQEMQAAAEQRRMQMDQIRAQQMQAQAQARQQAQQQERMNQLLNMMRSGGASKNDIIELAGLSSGQAQQRGLWSMVENMDQNMVRSTIGRTLQITRALENESPVAMQMLDEAIEADPQNTALKRLKQIAEVDQKEAAVHARLSLNAMGPEGQKAFEGYQSAMPESAKTQDTAPKPERVSLGDRVAIIDQNPNSPTFNQELRSLPMGAGPMTQAQINANQIAEARLDLDRARVENDRVGVQQAERRLRVLEEEARQRSDPAFRSQIAAAEAAGSAAGRQQVERASTLGEINVVVSELERALDKGGLIDRATGSGVGALRDVAAGFVGRATPGAIAIGQLQPIADLVLKIVPRFEGPQSDKDTQSYREAAGKLADPTVPNEIRRAAATEIVRVLKDRKGRLGSTVTIPMQPAGGAMPAAGAVPTATGAVPPQAPTAPSAGFPAPPQAAIDALRSGRGTAAQFDEVFGPGAAARVMGR